MRRRSATTPLLLLAIAIGGLPVSSSGQDYIDLVRISYGRSGSASFEGSNDKTRIVDFAVDTTIPVPVTRGVTLLTGLMYEVFETKLYKDENAHTFQSTGVKLGINFTSHENHWMGTCLVLPRISTDFKNVNRHSLQIGGLVVFRKRINKYANYKAGVYINSEFFGTWIVPMVGLYYYRPGRPWEVSVFLPISFDVNYSLVPCIRVGVMFTGMRRSYQLSTIPTYGGSGYLDRAANDLGGYVSLQITKRILVQLKVTYSLGRESRVFGKSDKISVDFPLASLGDNRMQLNDNVADGWQAQMLFIYRLRFNRNE